VNDTKTLKLLVVEDNLEDEQLLCEALIEIEENRQWCNWRAAAIVQVDQLADALDCLRRERFDAVLLNLSLPDSPALLDTFLEIDACAQEAPVIVLADEPDEHLANRLLRDGAQDILLKSELECAHLARSVRYAIERQRRIAGAQYLYPRSDDRAADRSPAFYEASDSNETPEEHELRELLLLQAGEVFNLQNHQPFIGERRPAKTVMLAD
jgi:DNA-binding NarL/FixJ family response regulator